MSLRKGRRSKRMPYGELKNKYVAVFEENNLYYQLLQKMISNIYDEKLSDKKKIAKLKELTATLVGDGMEKKKASWLNKIIEKFKNVKTLL